MPAFCVSAVFNTTLRQSGSTETSLVLVEEWLQDVGTTLWAKTPLWSSAVPELVFT